VRSPPRQRWARRTRPRRTRGGPATRPGRPASGRPASPGPHRAGQPGKHEVRPLRWREGLHLGELLVKPRHGDAVIKSGHRRLDPFALEAGADLLSRCPLHLIASIEEGPGQGHHRVDVAPAGRRGEQNTHGGIITQGRTRPATQVLPYIRRRVEVYPSATDANRVRRGTMTRHEQDLTGARVKSQGRLGLAGPCPDLPRRRWRPRPDGGVADRAGDEDRQTRVGGLERHRW
jgi:hypothetical protein